jgi:hypothetical protein
MLEHLLGIEQRCRKGHFWIPFKEWIFRCRLRQLAWPRRLVVEDSGSLKCDVAVDVVLSVNGSWRSRYMYLCKLSCADTCITWEFPLAPLCCETLGSSPKSDFTNSNFRFRSEYRLIRHMGTQPVRSMLNARVQLARRA